MMIKEQENQLSLNLNLRVVTTLIVYFTLIGFIAFRLSSVSRVPRLIDIVSGAGVPTLKLDNFGKLSGSIKAPAPVSSVPVVRPEPFD